MNLITIPFPVREQRGDACERKPEARIAWLAPSLARGWRWQALFKEFSLLHPEMIVYTVDWPGCTPGFEGAFRIQKIPGFKFVGPRSGGTGRSRGFMCASPRVLLDLLKFRPDIILSNGFHVWTLCAIVAKALLKCRLVLLWQGVSAEAGVKPGWLRLRLRRWMGRCFDVSATNTRAGVNYLEAQVRIPSGKIRRFVGETASAESFTHHAKPPSIESIEKPVFLFVGSLIPEKGVDRLLAACALLTEMGYGHFSAVIVGAGPEEKALRQLAQVLGIEPRVHWKGFVPYANLGAFYQHSDVLVLPSTEDTWGVAVAEAMAFGKPVLCSRRAGVFELVAHGVNGFLFDPDRPEQLAGFMRELIQRPELIAEFGKASEAIAARNCPATASRTLSEIACGNWNFPGAGARAEAGTRQTVILQKRKTLRDASYFLNSNFKAGRR